MTSSEIRNSAQIRQDFLDFFKSKQHTIVPSASLMPDAPNLLFTNAGMNQFVPIFLGQQTCPYQPPRAADTQKCIRAGGKHNDLEDVGLDTYHHTFFEMLGNWSFGDYFKKEAIDWAWELVTEIWNFPKHRIYATVYCPGPGDPSHFDQEAYDFWAAKFSAAGLDPKVHVVSGNKKDNFWMMGETGPCGPCSELHVDLTPQGDTKGALVNQGTAECIEIWNLVFIQYNANPDGTFSALPSRHVDTGMGFERVTAIIQGTKNFKDFGGNMSNYETDVFRPIFDKLEKLSGKRYASTLPAAGTNGTTEQEKLDIAFRVIADHIRTLGFAIADGILPGNTDRNYVLRRILRRAVRYGRTLGFHEPFFFKLVHVLAEKMGDVFPEIRERQGLVETTIRTEEESFNNTLDRGIELFREEISRPGNNKELAGDFAFKLYDTYGFPLDLTELMARESGLIVDTAGFEARMEEQRARARAARKKEIISVSNIETAEPTRFVGFDKLATQARVLETVAIQEKTAVILDVSPFYAEMGGQVGDRGELMGNGQVWHIVNTRKAGNVFLHFLAEPDGPIAGAELNLRVDSERRAAIQRHHTVTHLFHWALHEVAGPEATQKGSYVGPEKLTFDFNSAPLTAGQVRDIERLVNERVLENQPVSWREIPYAEAKPRQDILQFFGEKYGDLVRVVQIGGKPEELNGYSMELCGGTHTRATGEIGLFRILSESAIAAGVRRIEAVAGLAAYEKTLGETELLSGLAVKINAPVLEVEKKLESVLAHQKELEKQLKSLRQNQAAEFARSLSLKARSIGSTRAIIENLGDAEGDFVQSVAEALKSEFNGVVVLGAASNGNVSLVAAVSPEFIKKFPAGKIIQTIAPLVGGKGGGRPEQARGGGKEPGKIDEALARAAEFLE
jgi:alanyl-tRNA synthetase